MRGQRSAKKKGETETLRNYEREERKMNTKDEVGERERESGG